ncbi:MAG: hypothetical protein M1598_01740, partial [Actinobacteria bacterium]|nr:hypothetical protein [Actinomycetota bacterium]
QEMKDAARALGKERLADISIDDLYALSWETAAITGARLVYADRDGPPEMDGHVRPAYRMPEPTTEDAPPPVH